MNRVPAAALSAVTEGGVTRPPSRVEIRAYIAAKVAELKAHAAAGGNPQHMLADHQDQLDAFVALLPPDARDEFVRVYTEEYTIAVNDVRQQVEQKELAEIHTTGKRFAWASVAMTIVVVLFLVAIFRLL